MGRRTTNFLVLIGSSLNPTSGIGSASGGDDVQTFVEYRVGSTTAGVSRMGSKKKSKIPVHRLSDFVESAVKSGDLDSSAFEFDRGEGKQIVKFRGGRLRKRLLEVKCVPPWHTAGLEQLNELVLKSIPKPLDAGLVEKMRMMVDQTLSINNLAQAIECLRQRVDATRSDRIVADVWPWLFERTNYFGERWKELVAVGSKYEWFKREWQPDTDIETFSGSFEASLSIRNVDGKLTLVQKVEIQPGDGRSVEGPLKVIELDEDVSTGLLSLLKSSRIGGEVKESASTVEMDEEKVEELKEVVYQLYKQTRNQTSLDQIAKLKEQFANEQEKIASLYPRLNRQDIDLVWSAYERKPKAGEKRRLVLIQEAEASSSANARLVVCTVNQKEWESVDPHSESAEIAVARAGLDHDSLALIVPSTVVNKLLDEHPLPVAAKGDVTESDSKISRVLTNTQARCLKDHLERYAEGHWEFFDEDSSSRSDSDAQNEMSVECQLVFEGSTFSLDLTTSEGSTFSLGLTTSEDSTISEGLPTSEGSTISEDGSRTSRPWKILGYPCTIS